MGGGLKPNLGGSVRPWLEEVLRSEPQPLPFLYTNSVKFVKSHPVLTNFKRAPYLFLTAASESPHCLVLPLKDGKIAGIEVINIQTQEAMPAKDVDLGQIQWSIGVWFTFGHMAEVLECLKVNLDDVTEVKSVLLLLKPVMLSELWRIKHLMRAEWRRYPEVLTALSTQFLAACESGQGDTWDLIAQFMVAYITTERP